MIDENVPSEEQILARLFEQFGTSRHYKKNEFIFREDDESQDIYYVKDGFIKISQSAHEGQGITLFLRKTGEVFGAAEVVTGQKRQRYARCILDSEVLVITSSHFMNLVLSQQELLHALLVSNARRLLHTQRYVEMLISRPVAWRMAHFLFQLGKLQANNEIMVSLPLSHEEISYIIGCSRQTITETLNKWRDNGFIHYDRKHVIIYNYEHFMSVYK